MTEKMKLFTSLEDAPLDFWELTKALEKQHPEIKDEDKLSNDKKAYKKMAMFYNTGRINQLDHMIKYMTKEVINVGRL